MRKKKIDIKDMQKQLMSKIDTDNLVEVGKVERYCQLLHLDKMCDESIEKDGASIEIVNGSQRFVKSHPCMNDKVKINSQLIALEKSINFKPVEVSIVEGVDGKESSALI